MNEAIETEEDSNRVPKNEETVIESLKKEVKKLKIENNRSETETKVHYGDRMSRRDHQNWRDYRENKRDGSRSNYKRSDSHPGLWRSRSGNNYRRFKSKTPTRQESRGSKREGSGSRSDGEKSLKDRVTSIETKLDTTDKKLDAITEALQVLTKTKNVTIAPMFIRDNNIELDEDKIAVSDAVSEILFR